MNQSNAAAMAWYGFVAVASAATLLGLLLHLGIRPLNAAHWKALSGYYLKTGGLPVDLLVGLGIWFLCSMLAIAAGPALGRAGEYGDARWATRSELRRFKPGLTAKAGVVLGRFGGIGRFSGRLLMSAEPLSALVVAPAGTGKTDGVIVPSVLMCDPFSLVVNDPKGELYERTAGHRATLGRVLRIEWTAGAAGSVCWNPIDLGSLPTERGARGDLIDRLIAVLIPGDERDFWISSGRAALAACALFQIYEGERLGFAPSFGSTLEWLARLGEGQGPDVEDPVRPNLDRAARIADIEGYPSRVGAWLRQLAMMDYRTRSNVVATISAALKIFSNENVASVTARTDFTLGDLRGIDGRPVTVYIVVPAFDQDAFGKITALFVESATRFLTERKPRRGELGVRFILDEVGFLPPIQAISMGPAITRGYGVSFLFACQDYGQLKDRWGQGGLDNIITNTAFKVVLSQNHPDTAAMISRAVGNTTRRRKSRSKQVGLDKGPFAGGSVSEQREGSPLIRPEEIMSMEFGRHFVLAQNRVKRPIWCRSAYYMHVPALRRRAGRAAPALPQGIASRST
ncbi:type IV secretory system conjugative DNA transfer family protein [Desertibaculum subflavum]|uniref:type IV secretory system conjugative DNA transfer family protein n=1 Tax=Desertibaculum subflavum TaxID=2268458 RepID=UPI000E660E16